MNAILYNILKPGTIRAYGRLYVTSNEIVTSLTDNVASKYNVDLTRSITPLDNVASGDILVVNGNSYIIKTIEKNVLSVIDLYNLFKAPRLSTSIVTIPDISSYIASLISEGIAVTQNQKAFAVAVDTNANNYKQRTSISASSDDEASKQVLTQIPELLIKSLNASLYSKVNYVYTPKNQLTNSSIGFVVGARPILTLNAKYDDISQNRGISDLSINDKMIDFNASLVSSSDGNFSQKFYLNQDGTISQTLPSWITSIQATGTIYDSSETQSTPEQLAKGTLPTSQGSNFTLSLAKTSELSVFVGLGNIWNVTIFKNSKLNRKISGTLTQIKETGSKYELTFGFNNPRLVLSI